MDFRPHQQAALDAILQAMESGQRIINVEMVSGTGKTAVLTELIRYLSFNAKGTILIVTSLQVLLEQISSSLRKENITFSVDIKGNPDISIITCAKLRRILKQGNYDTYFKYILCFGVTNDVSNMDLEKTEYSTLISFSDPGRSIKGWVHNNKPVYIYTLENAVKDGYLTSLNAPQMHGLAVEGFCLRLFESLGFKHLDIPHKGNFASPDLIINSQAGVILVDIKTYRNRPVPTSDIDRAIIQMLGFKQINQQWIDSREIIDCCLVLFGQVSEDKKASSYKTHGITIWDISNILYFIQDNSQQLDELMRLMLFPVSSFSPTPPVGWGSTLSGKIVCREPTFSIAEELEKRLNNCKAGKQQAIDYENICNDILSYLFDNEFTVMSRQHFTHDELFRMDLLCTLKGSSAFWDFLIKHYNSRFVVFEYKNHTPKLSQNFIYITEKYLFNAALRNVAIIISRNGFSKNADIAAKGCLKEHGKLIIELIDEDLVNMLRKKASGEEPSDYLLTKTESFLMSIGK